MIENLDVFFGDDLDAVDVVANSVTFRGLLDTTDEFYASNNVILSTDYFLTCKSTDADTLTDLQVISVDGLDFKVREKRRVGDGALSKVRLSKT